MSAALMPDLSSPRRGYRHTLDSALSALAAAGLGMERITVRMAGRGRPTGTIVDQQPAPGIPLTADRSVLLWVAGDGFFASLPPGAWDRGDESAPGTAEIVEQFDDPIAKARRFIREGTIFDIQPGNLPACARWIALFGLDPEIWPAELWYPLAVLLPSLHRLAGNEQGLRFTLRALLNIPVLQVIPYREALSLTADRQTRLGRQFGQLGYDFVVGCQIEHVAGYTLVLGPVGLPVYCEYRDPTRKARLDAVLRLMGSCYDHLRIVWRVAGEGSTVELGNARRNGLLTLNARLAGAATGSLP